MDCTIYKAVGQDLKNYMALQRGYLGYHKKTKTPLIIYSIERFRGRFDYRCKILQIEGKEQNLCDVIYSENEVDLTPIKRQDFIDYHNKIQGEQLTLF
ncbi:hypothetical protein SAMN05421789_11048 [Kaistella chaponensis]|uniref:Uncharacterized protein n=1 Tax=Kaistella chaponensis TaxID=713588 RepID=A0A1N7MU79_9FLAO|nr:hypothetical protein [Kaistella chaponensis]SIS89695.1 hypothetical protein SAMN05421789_11048 [Kaistella chaponensis]